MAALLFRGTTLALAWWVLAEGRADSWGVGAVSVAFALAASLHLAPPTSHRLSPAGLLGFAGFFLPQSCKGGVQVAARAFRPRMDLAPALVEVPVALPEGLARVLLAISLLLGLQGLFTYWPVMQALFHTAPLDVPAWGRILALGLLLFAIVELEKGVVPRMGGA